MRYGIQSIPNMMLFEGGAPKAAAVGAMPKGMLERQLGFELAEHVARERAACALRALEPLR